MIKKNINETFLNFCKVFLGIAITKLCNFFEILFGVNVVFRQVELILFVYLLKIYVIENLKETI